MTAGFFVMYAISDAGNRGIVAAIFIALLNALLPAVIRTLTLLIGGMFGCQGGVVQKGMGWYVMSWGLVRYVVA